MCHSVKSKGLKVFLIVMATVVSSSLDELHAFQSTRCATLRTRGDASTSLHGVGEIKLNNNMSTFRNCYVASYLFISPVACAITSDMQDMVGASLSALVLRMEWAGDRLLHERSS